MYLYINKTYHHSLAKKAKVYIFYRRAQIILNIKTFLTILKYA